MEYVDGVTLKEWLTEMSFDERKAKRQELARPIMEAMKLWMETEGVKYSENSLIGKAITYAYTRWDNMMRNHDVNPRDYLNDVISQMSHHTKASNEELLQLLPHKWKLTHPESVMTQTK